ncbi:MAG: hypothetical protein KA354_02475 [Phycisphaerae bacterium]|nr:hypothetical protein [Phycisphaerae bacterium]
MASLTLQIWAAVIGLARLAILAGMPSAATDPTPANGARGVAADVTLRWKAGDGQRPYRVYLGTTSPGLHRGIQTGAVFRANHLLPGRTYYWRVDEVNGDGPARGDVWQFTTRSACVAGDMDADGTVDNDDFGRFQECLAGAGGAILDQDCIAADLDADRDVDIRDIDAFVKSLRGQTRPGPVHGTGSHLTTGLIPPRPAGAITGSAFVAELLDAPLDRREARIREEITSGNIPDFLRVFVPVTATATIDGRPHRISYEVAPDYLAIGSDTDFVRMPMTPQTAQAIADRFECVLPTRKMVNDIYAQAAAKLAPSPISPRTIDITHIATFYLHHLVVEGRRAGQPPGLLVGGVKKDVVMTPQLAARPGKVAIYGWHQLDGQPIQPLFLGHSHRWVDYSQCIRLVRGYVTVDGKTKAMADVLDTLGSSALLSDEGPIGNPRYPE